MGETVGTEEERTEAITRRLLGWTGKVYRGGLGCLTDDCSEWETGKCWDGKWDMHHGTHKGGSCVIGLTIETD